MENGEPITRAEFQGRVSAGDTVTALGDLVGAAVSWKSIQLKDSN
jgi:hypothetical protein